MTYDPEFTSFIKDHHGEIEEEVKKRISEFDSIWNERDERRALSELLFCILTPQSKAQVCWGAIDRMGGSGVLLQGGYDEVLDAVGKVRFKYRKAGFLIEARDRFHSNGKTSLLAFLEGIDDPLEARYWFVKNIKGLGYKEAGHFLRNIGLGKNIAILDRHILRNLVKAGVIEEIPGSLTERRYLEIEESMRAFANNINIQLSHLDLVIWHIATGTIFK